MRRHLPLVSASAVVFLVFTSPLLPRQAALGQVKSSIQARAQVVNAQASWSADRDVRDMLERAFRAVPLTGSPIDMVMKMKAAAGHAPDGIGVFFNFEGERAGLTESGTWPVYTTAAFAKSGTLLGDRRLTAGSAKMLPPKRLVVYVHHLAN